MFHAQFFKDFLSGLHAPCLKVYISLPNAFHRVVIVLPLPIEVGSQSVVKGGGGILALSPGVVVQLGLAFGR
jgi:hypothetical protein